LCEAGFQFVMDSCCQPDHPAGTDDALATETSQFDLSSWQAFFPGGEFGSFFERFFGRLPNFFGVSVALIHGRFQVRAIFIQKFPFDNFGYFPFFIDFDVSILRMGILFCTPHDLVMFHRFKTAAS